MIYYLINKSPAVTSVGFSALVRVPQRFAGQIWKGVKMINGIFFLNILFFVVVLKTLNHKSCVKWLDDRQKVQGIKTSIPIAHHVFYHFLCLNAFKKSIKYATYYRESRLKLIMNAF